RDAMTSNEGINLEDFAVLVGSSRGATGVLEEAHKRFLSGKKLFPDTSPNSTAAAFPAAVSRLFATRGPSLFLSSACSSSMSALGVALAMIRAGQVEGAVVVGAEAPLTPFTFAQLDRLGIYCHSERTDFPYR